MANPRSTETKIPRVVRQATAAPVDTYVRPDTSQANQLAEALGEITPKLKQFSEEWAQRKNAETEQAGVAMAQKMAAEGKLAADLTRSGDLAMQDNAWFRAGLEEEAGRLAAGKWRSEFIGSDEFKAVQESTDLKDFDTAAMQFNARFEGNNLGGGSNGTEFYQRGFGTLQSNYQSAARYEFATGIEGKLGAQSDAVLFGRLATIVTEDNEKGIDPAVTIAAINKLQEQTIARGRHETFVRRTVVDAMDEVARKMEPIEGLKLVHMWEGINGEGGVAIGKSKYGMEKLDKLKADLVGEVWRKESRDIAEVERTEKKLIETGQREFQEALTKNGADTGQSILAKPEYQSVRAKLTASFSQQVQANDSLVFRSNEYVVRNTLAKIFDPKEGEPEVTTSFIGSLRNVSPSDKVMLNNQLEARSRAKESGSWDRLFKDPAINEQRKLIEGYFADPITKLVPREKVTKLGGAIMAFNARVLGGLESGEYDEVKTGERLAWLGAVRAEVGGLDPTIMNSQDIQGVKAYLLDPNQPELGSIPIGKPAGRLGDRGQPKGTAPQGSSRKEKLEAAKEAVVRARVRVAVAEHTFSPEMIDAAIDEGHPMHSKIRGLVMAVLKDADVLATDENITLFIEEQIEARAGGAK